MRFSFRATESLVAQSLVRVRMFLDDNMLSASDAETVELVLGEALNNSVEHALAGINGATVDLEIACQDRSVICLIRDRGRPMPPGTMEKDHPCHFDGARRDLPEGGFGWFMIRRLSRNLSYHRTGGENQLRIEVPVGLDQPGMIA